MPTIIDADTHVATSQKSRANVDAALHADRSARLTRLVSFLRLFSSGTQLKHHA